jgi:hypothetical protein
MLTTSWFFHPSNKCCFQVCIFCHAD